MNKKLGSIMLAMTMVAASMTGCSGSNNNGGSTEPATDTAATTETTTTEETTDAGSSEVATADEGKVFNIRVWNEEFKTRVEDCYPGYEKIDGTTGKIGDVDVNWIIVPNDDNAYQNALDEALLQQESLPQDEKIDMFLFEADAALKYVDTDYTLDVINDLGLTEDELSHQYQYTKDVTTSSDGKLKGVSWQGCPGAMIYRRDVAKQVFGTDDTEKIQELFKDWDSFLTQAETLKQAGYLTTSSVNDTFRVFANNVSSPWVVDGKINIDANMSKWIEMSKTMVDKGYTTTYELWSDDWSKGFTTAGNVFCYFGPAWFIDFTLGGHDLDGQWAAIVGPQSFYWGGTWIAGCAGTDNKALIADIMRTLTVDEATMIDIVKTKNDFVNNKEAMEAMAADTSYQNVVLGGQNPLGMFCEGADQISLDNISPYDLGCTEEMQGAMKDYFDGNSDYDAALQVFYKNVETKYPELSH